MNALEKLKLTGRLKAAVDMRNIEKSPLKKLKAAKEVQDLRRQLGLIGGAAKASDKNGLQPLSAADLQPLLLPKDGNPNEQRKAIESYLKQFQGKTVKTSDNKTIRFSKKSKTHIANDIVWEKTITAEAVAYVLDVLETGDFIGRQQPDEPRPDFAAFHVYRKWADVDGAQVHIQVKAAELADGKLAADGLDLLAYTIKDYEADKEKEDSRKLSPDSESGAYDGFSTSVHDSAFKPTEQPLHPSLSMYHTAVFDRAQVEAEEYPPLVVEILEIREKSGAAEA